MNRANIWEQVHKTLYLLFENAIQNECTDVQDSAV